MLRSRRSRHWHQHVGVSLWSALLARSGRASSERVPAVNGSMSGRRAPRHWFPVVLLALAVCVLAFALSNGFGSYSLWRDTAASGIPDTITTAAARLTSTTTPTYLREGAPYDPAHDRLNPGESLTISFDTVVRVTGDTMTPSFTLTGYTIPEPLDDAITVAVTAPSLVVDPGVQTVTVTITITSPPEAVFSGEVIGLADAALVLQSGKSWSDTLSPLTVPLHDLTLSTPVMQLDFDTTLPGATTSVVVPVSGLTLGSVVVDWGDGSTPTVVVSAHPTHEYPAGQYTASVFGRFTGYGANTTALALSNASLVRVPLWEPNYVTDLSYAFVGASSLTEVAEPPSTVTNMTGMFTDATMFTQNIGGWNMAHVTNMQGMFDHASTFNADITGWDTASVTNMQGMFAGATAFNQNISGWNVANVTNMGSMFKDATTFNQSFGTWNTAKVTTMSEMFQGATAFNQPLPWTTASVSNMQGMFNGATAFNQNIGGWNVANVTNMAYMFKDATAFNQTFGTWNTAKVTTMSEMFQGATAFNQSLPWNTASVTNMQGMFKGATTFNQSFGTWNTAKVTTMSEMFQAATAFNGSLSNFNVANVTNMDHMFAGATTFTQNIGGWNVAKVTNMDHMFNSALAFSVSLSNWNVSANIPKMPAGWNANAPGLSVPNWSRWPSAWQDLMQLVYQTDAPGGTNTIVLPIDGLTLGTVTVDWGDGTPKETLTAALPTHTYPASGTYTVTINGKFTRYGATPTPELDASQHSLTTVPSWGPNGVLDASHAFEHATNLTSMPTTGPPATVTNLAYMFAGATAYTQSLSTWNVANVTNMAYMFADATTFNGTIGNWNVANVTNMDHMFAGATAFNNNGSTGINNWNVAKVTNMDHMFNGATAFSVSISNWNVSANIPRMPTAWNANAPGLSAPNWSRWPAAWQDVMQLVYQTDAPDGTNTIVLPIDGLTLGTVTVDWGDGTPKETLTTALPTHTYPTSGTYTVTINGKFTRYGATPTPELDASQHSLTTVIGWGANGVTDASHAFEHATNLTSMPTTGPPTTVTNLAYLFAGATTFNQPLNTWNTANVTNMAYMFNGATAFSQSVGGWNVANVTNMDHMFAGATAFNNNTSATISNWNVAKVTNMDHMFNGATAFNQPLNWNVASVTNMDGMFAGASKFNQNIGSWNVAKVTNMDNMFNGATAFAQSLSSWNVGANIPLMPPGWNTGVPGLADPTYRTRWPAAWQ